MKRLFFITLSLLLFIACNKDDNGTTYKIKGQVVEYGTEVPVANALVYATGYQEDNSVVFLDSTRSDANGEYNLTVTGFAVNAIAAKEGYDGRNSEKPVNDDGSYRNLTLVLDPYAWLDVTLKNVSGAYELGFGINSSGQYPVELGNVFHHSQKVLGNREIAVGISKKDTSGLKTLSQFVFCPGHDTTFLYLEY